MPRLVRFRCARTFLAHQIEPRHQGELVHVPELGVLADPRIDRCGAGHARQLGDLVQQHAVADGLTDLGTEFDVVRAISARPSYRR